MVINSKNMKKKTIKIKHLRKLLIEKFYYYLSPSDIKNNSISAIDIELAKILFK